MAWGSGITPRTALQVVSGHTARYPLMKGPNTEFPICGPTRSTLAIALPQLGHLAAISNSPSCLLILEQLGRFIVCVKYIIAVWYVGTKHEHYLMSIVKL